MPNGRNIRGFQSYADGLDEISKEKLRKLLNNKDSELVRSKDMLNRIDVMIILGINPLNKDKSKEFSLVEFDKNDEISREELYKILGL